jgi:hypothetical protein
MEQNPHARFSQLLEQHINRVVKRLYVDETLTPVVLKSIHATVRREIDTVFMRSSHKLEDAARSWLADQFFKAIRINDDVTVGDQVITNEYRLDQLSYHDVELLRNLFDQTGLSESLNEEMQHRSLS